MNTRRWALLSMLLLSACGTPDGMPGVVLDPDATPGSGGGILGGGGSGGGEQPATLPAVYQKFKTADSTCGSSVKVTINPEDPTVVVIDSNGIPNHGSPYFEGTNPCMEPYSGPNPGFASNGNLVSGQTQQFRIPRTPTVSTTHPAPTGRPIGVALNGVPFFNQFAADGTSSAETERDSFDQYHGHPEFRNDYHYHVVPLSLTASEGSEALLGFLLDGYPVYGPEEGGVAVDPADLDVYHGHEHVTADYPSGTYHYHATDTAPYILGSGFYGEPGTVTR